MSRFVILRLTQAIKVRKADITFCSASILHKIPDALWVAHHDGSRIVDDLAHPTALLARPRDIASETLVGYFLETS